MAAGALWDQKSPALHHALGGHSQRRGFTGDFEGRGWPRKSWVSRRGRTHFSDATCDRQRTNGPRLNRLPVVSQRGQSRSAQASRIALALLCRFDNALRNDFTDQGRLSGVLKAHAPRQTPHPRCGSLRRRNRFYSIPNGRIVAMRSSVSNVLARG
jgi:hypothetical protein